MPKKHKEGYCQICGREIDVIVSAYQNRPFVDGRNYREICFCCSEVPKIWEFFETYDDGVRVHKEIVVYYNGFDQDRLHTLEEMQKDGFGKIEAQQSIKAVKKAIKKGLKLPSPTPLPIPERRPSPPPPQVAKVEDHMSHKKKRRRKHRHNHSAQNAPKKKSKYHGPLKTDVIIREINEGILDNKVCTTT